MTAFLLFQPIGNQFCSPYDHLGTMYSEMGGICVMANYHSKKKADTPERVYLLPGGPEEIRCLTTLWSAWSRRRPAVGGQHPTGVLHLNGFESLTTVKIADTRMGICYFWQRMRDSNPRKRSQSPVCYRYTNPLCVTIVYAVLEKVNNHFPGPRLFQKKPQIRLPFPIACVMLIETTMRGSAAGGMERHLR